LNSYQHFARLQITRASSRPALGSALLFLGYTLSDWDFLVLFRLFANKLRDSGNTHIAVQLEPSEAPGEQAEKAAKAVKYLDSYFGSAQVKFIGALVRSFARNCECGGKPSAGDERFAFCRPAAF
jgi:hypothetical protein